eukprot:7378757-Prymnesium_polylepis.1
MSLRPKHPVASTPKPPRLQGVLRAGERLRSQRTFGAPGDEPALPPLPGAPPPPDPPPPEAPPPPPPPA